MTAPATPPPGAVRLYTRRSRRGRWTLAGEYPSADAAWAALRALPAGVQVWVNDQIPPPPDAPPPGGLARAGEGASGPPVTPHHPPPAG